MAESEWRTLIRAVHAELDAILTLEGRAKPDLEFGRKAFGEEQRAPKVCWIQPGGSFSKRQQVTEEIDAEEAVPILGVRLALSAARIWHTSDEHAEHLLDRLWLATDKVSTDRFRWDEAKYEFPTEIVGQALKHGVSMILLQLPVWLQVPREYDGESVFVEIDDTKIRTGIESPVGEDIEDTAYEVNEFVDPAQTSES